MYVIFKMQHSRTDCSILRNSPHTILSFQHNNLITYCTVIQKSGLKVVLSNNGLQFSFGYLACLWSAKKNENWIPSDYFYASLIPLAIYVMGRLWDNYYGWVSSKFFWIISSNFFSVDGIWNHYASVKRQFICVHVPGVCMHF